MNFHIGLSALRASQFAINTVSQNLANANTPGYHRQRVNLQTRDPQWSRNGFLGAGVEIHSVDRIRNQVLESAYTDSLSDLNEVQTRLSAALQIESQFLAGDGSVHDALSGLFNEVSQLAANPGELVQRSAVVQHGIQIADQTSLIANDLAELKQKIHTQAELEVDQLNLDIKELVSLQKRIKAQENNNADNHVPSDLYDQRDQLINRIAQRIDINRVESVNDGFGLTLAGNSISVGNNPVQFEVVSGESGELNFQIAGTDTKIDPVSGSLAALSDIHNNTIDKYLDKVNTFAQELIRNFDQAHAKGVGTDGPFTVLYGARKVQDVNAPLEDAGLAFPIESGSLFISVTDGNGDKRTHEVSIDPSVDSLADLAAKISGFDNINAVVNEQEGTLSIIALPGFKFDFTGSLETVPDLTTFSGTATPRLGGQYEGSANRPLSVQIIGSGDVGVSDSLLAQVTDEVTGQVIAEVEIGNGYEAGSPIDIGQGVTMSFDSGTVNDGDQFSTQLIAESDETGTLSALGLNSFFSGTNANNIGVEKRIIENPDQLAASKSGDIADTSNLVNILGLRHDQVVEGKLSLEDHLSETTSLIGSEVQSTRFLQQSVSGLNYQYESQIAAVSGVDLNEEMINLAHYQKSYEAAVQVMRTMETMLDDLFTIVR